MDKDTTCLKCGHTWLRRVEDPIRCPRCTNPKYNRPLKNRKPKNDISNPITKPSFSAPDL